MAFNNPSGTPGVGDTETEAAAALGVAVAATETNPEERKFVALPRNYTLVPLEEYRAQPSRIKEQTNVADAASFAAYVNRFKTSSTIITTNAAAVLAKARSGTLPDVTFTAHLEYHAPDQPSWDEHIASLTLIRTREWVTWCGANKKKMNQLQLCEFIEENMPDIVEPESARLLEMMRKFEVKKEVIFNSFKNLTNGDTQFVFQETSTGTSEKGTVEIPEAITIGVRVFEGADAYKVPIKLRWKLTDQRLELSLDLLRYQRFERDALTSVQKEITTAVEAPLFQVAE